MAFQRRTVAGGGTGHTAGSGDRAPVWVKLSRRGTTITASQSLNGTTWTVVGADVLSLPQPFYIGLALTSHNTQTASTATFDNVVVQAPSANQPPSVSLTAPAHGATYTAPAAVTVSATASDTDGTITRVDFYQGSTLIGSDTTSPYSFAWNNVPAGTYSLTAVATDNAGAVTTSAARTITVTGTSTQRRAVFNPSADHATLVTSYRFEVFAAGANPSTATPLASQDLGKPAPVNGEISVEVTATLNGLAPGTYQATVSAVGSSGSSRSAPTTFTR
jgi:hypothetical protein